MEDAENYPRKTCQIEYAIKAVKFFAENFNNSHKIPNPSHDLRTLRR